MVGWLVVWLVWVTDGIIFCFVVDSANETFGHIEKRGQEFIPLHNVWSRIFLTCSWFVQDKLVFRRNCYL